MDVEDFLEPEIAVAAAVTAAITSPQVRKALRTGAVYGLAGLISAGDAIATFSKSVGRGVQQATSNVQPGSNAPGHTNGAQPMHGASEGSMEGSHG